MALAQAQSTSSARNTFAATDRATDQGQAYAGLSRSSNRPPVNGFELRFNCGPNERCYTVAPYGYNQVTPIECYNNGWRAWHNAADNQPFNLPAGNYVLRFPVGTRVFQSAAGGQWYERETPMILEQHHVQADTIRYEIQLPVRFNGEYCSQDQHGVLDSLTDAQLDTLEIGCAIAGLIPGAGNAADALGVAIAGMRGDIGGAIIGAICMIPGLGLLAGSARVVQKLRKLLGPALRNLPTGQLASACLSAVVELAGDAFWTFVALVRQGRIGRALKGFLQDLLRFPDEMANLVARSFRVGDILHDAKVLFNPVANAVTKTLYRADHLDDVAVATRSLDFTDDIRYAREYLTQKRNQGVQARIKEVTVDQATYNRLLSQGQHISTKRGTHIAGASNATSGGSRIEIVFSRELVQHMINHGALR